VLFNQLIIVFFYFTALYKQPLYDASVSNGVANHVVYRVGKLTNYRWIDRRSYSIMRAGMVVWRT